MDALIMTKLTTNADIDECANNECKSPGTKECSDLVNSYKCTCNPGYEGVYCENDVDDCGHSNCLHGSTCQDRVDNYFCKCQLGYDGKHCENNIDECIANICSSNTVECNDHINGYTCTCLPGFTGRYCNDG